MKWTKFKDALPEPHTPIFTTDCSEIWVFDSMWRVENELEHEFRFTVFEYAREYPNHAWAYVELPALPKEIC